MNQNLKYLKNRFLVDYYSNYMTISIDFDKTNLIFKKLKQIYLY